MAGMTATTPGIATSQPFTVADLEGMPDDGKRYELIDGMLFVSPAPMLRHQKMLGQLYIRLDAACPAGLHVITAPFSFQPSDSTELQPDVFVARHEDFTDTLLPVAPLLAVEVLSPSTTLYDLNTKKAVYERHGVSSYWILDPQDPTLTVFEVDAHGRYQQIAEVKGDDEFHAERPFPVTVVPVELLGSLAP